MNFALYRITTPIAVLGVAGVARGIAAHAWHVVQPSECTVLGVQVIVFTPWGKVFMSSHFTLSSYIKATCSYVCV